MNARSIAAEHIKLNDFKLYLTSHDIDCCIITEMWPRDTAWIDDPITSQYAALAVKLVSPDGYNIISNPGKCSPGGGLALVFKDTIETKLVQAFDFVTCEYSEFVVNLQDKNLTFCAIYKHLQSSILSLLGEFTSRRKYDEPWVNEKLKQEIQLRRLKEHKF